MHNGRIAIRAFVNLSGFECPEDPEALEGSKGSHPVVPSPEDPEALEGSKGSHPPRNEKAPQGHWRASGSSAGET